MFIFEEILCSWGVLEEIITDNGPAFIEALNWLAEQYEIHHIHISTYNSQANRIIKHHHLDVWEAIMKVCDREERTCVRGHPSISLPLPFLSYLYPC
jgi:hypothetical protein